MKLETILQNIPNRERIAVITKCSKDAVSMWDSAIEQELLNMLENDAGDLSLQDYVELRKLSELHDIKEYLGYITDNLSYIMNRM